MTVEQDVQRFKVELLRKMPFYGDIVMRLSFEKNEQIQTACTDGMKIYYNPKFFEPLKQGERYFILMHEVMHVLLMHCRRYQNRDAKIWNTACDIIVNQMLLSLKRNMVSMGIPFQRPENGIYESVSLDTTTEELYEEISILNKKRKKNSKTLLIRRSFLRNSVFGKNDNTNMQKITVMDDLDDYFVNSDGRIKSGPNGNRTVEEIEANEKLIKRMVKEALSKNCLNTGSYYIPNQLIQLTESKRLNWRTLLKGFLNQKISDEASYTTPERKYLHMDLILPGYSMTDEELDEIWAFVDSSGSISEKELNQFLTQLYRLSKEFHCVINICYWDTKVTDVYRNIRKEADIFKCTPRHSGGTNINCVYEWIDKNKVKPDVMVILTDGTFGHLTTPSFKKRYQRQTILVISSDRFVTDEMKKIGKIATL